MQMSKQALKGKTIGIFAANGFNETNMADMQRTILGSGGIAKIISVDTGLISGVNANGWGLNFPVDSSIGDVLSSDLDAIVVLGGSSSVEKFVTSAHTKRIINGALENDTVVVLLDDAVTAVSLLDNTSGFSVSATEETKEAVTKEGVEVLEAPFTISGSLITGSITDADQGLIEAFVTRTQGAGEETLKQAA